MKNSYHFLLLAIFLFLFSNIIYSQTTWVLYTDSPIFCKVKDDATSQADIFSGAAASFDVFYNPSVLPNTILYLANDGIYKSDEDGSNRSMIVDFSVPIDGGAVDGAKALVYTGVRFISRIKLVIEFYSATWMDQTLVFS